MVAIKRDDTSKTIRRNTGDLPSASRSRTSSSARPPSSTTSSLRRATSSAAQGFYVASSQDGASKTIDRAHRHVRGPRGTARWRWRHAQLLRGPPHRRRRRHRQKYENAKGFAAVQTLHPGDGVGRDSIYCSSTFTSFKPLHYQPVFILIHQFRCSVCDWCLLPAMYVTQILLINIHSVSLVVAGYFNFILSSDN